MDKNKLSVIVPYGQDIETIRNQYQSNNHKLILIISGKEGMINNITKTTKARLNT